MVPCAIESILRQSRLPDQIIIVDDGSTDDTNEVCKQYQSFVSYFYKKNGGKSSALNLALAHATGDLIYILDDDDVALKDALKMHEDALLSAPQAAFSYGPLLQGYLTSQGRIHVDRRPRLAQHDPADLYFKQLVSSGIGQPCLAFRRDCLKTIGGYDESFHHSEDYEFILRLTRHYCGVRLSNPIFINRQHHGIRGPAHSRVPYSEIRRKWRQYDSHAVEKQLQTLAFSDFSRTPLSTDPAANAERETYLRKSLVEFRCGRIADALLSIRHGFRRCPSAELTTEETWVSEMLLSSGWANAKLLSSFTLMFRFPIAFSGRAGGEALSLAMRRMFWRADWDLRKRRLNHGIRGILFVVYLWAFLRVKKVLPHDLP